MPQTAPLNSPDTNAPPNGGSALRDLFALSDEQILEIEPETVGQPLLAVQQESAPEQVGQPFLAVQEQSTPISEQKGAAAAALPEQSAPSSDSYKTAQAGMPAPLAPPKWLAERMNDPWNGEEAREFWQGIQREREEAATYRGVFAKPEDARAAAERSRQLEQIDQLYFGAAGKSPEDAAAAREQLAQTLLREDPAAFREMVFAGLRALERSPNNSVIPSEPAAGEPRDPGRIPSVTSAAANTAVPSHDSSAASRPATGTPLGMTNHLVAQYAAFEKAANADLDRDVGGAIGRVLEQALPVAQPLLAVRGNAETQAGVPALRERLSAAIRADIESALKNDRQLAEQVARQLAAKRFDDTTRAQVVRLIGERARQLVPGAARRVLNDWTQTALAAHRARTQRSEAAASRREIEPALAVAQPAVAQAFRPEALSAQRDARSAARSQRPVDYRKLSDEQILDL